MVIYMYDKQIVAFIDILGFKKLIDSCQNEPYKAEDVIINLQNAIDTKILSNLKVPLAETVNVQSKIFSDCICLATNCSKEQINCGPFVFGFLCLIGYMQALLIKNDVFVRGGVTVDHHFQNEKIIFSSALVKSYALESCEAIYPRILIDRTVIELLSNKFPDGAKDLLNDLIKCDDDGKFFLDYLFCFKQLDDGKFQTYISSHKASIISHLQLETETKIKKKYLWVAKYHNSKVDALGLGNNNKISSEILSCIDEDLDYFREIKNYIDIKNKMLFQRMHTQSNKLPMETKDNLSISFSNAILEDVEFILNCLQEENKRYAFSTIRNMVESIIKYKYFLKHENLIKQYFIGNPNMEINYSDPIKALNQLGQYRLQLPKISIMAKEVKEHRSNKKVLSLYDIFRLTSNHTHDGYHKDYSNVIEESCGYLDEYAILMMRTALESFLKSYSQEIMSK